MMIALVFLATANTLVVAAVVAAIVWLVTYPVPESCEGLPGARPPRRRAALPR